MLLLRFLGRLILILKLPAKTNEVINGKLDESFTYYKERQFQTQI